MKGTGGYRDGWSLVCLRQGLTGSPSWPGTRHIDQNGLEFRSKCLCLPVLGLPGIGFSLLTYMAVRVAAALDAGWMDSTHPSGGLLTPPSLPLASLQVSSPPGASRAHTFSMSETVSGTSQLLHFLVQCGSVGRFFWLPSLCK